MGKILDSINFFGKADRKGKNIDGMITSPYPAFYFRTQLDELIEDTDRKERHLEKGLIPATEIPFAKAEIKRNRKRIDEIKEAHPRLKPAEKDEVYKAYKELEGLIADAMFTRSEMKKGLADAHEEARRMTEPIIDVKGKEKFLHNMGITAQNGKISRNNAERAYKIMGRVLGENTNTERLRRDRKTGTFSIAQTLEEMLNG